MLPTLRSARPLSPNRRISSREISLICLKLLPEGCFMIVTRDWDTSIN
jgi:hypothetical protein